MLTKKCNLTILFPVASCQCFLLLAVLSLFERLPSVICLFPLCWTVLTTLVTFSDHLPFDHVPCCPCPLPLPPPLRSICLSATSLHLKFSFNLILCHINSSSHILPQFSLINNGNFIKSYWKGAKT